MMETKMILLEALEERWRKFRLELKTCKKEFSEEAVHDLRVATRRLLALFNLLRAVMPHKRINKIRRILKVQLDNLNDLRDVQVMLVDVSEAIHEQPDLRYFQSHLLKKEKSLMRASRKFVRTYDIKGLSQRVKKVRSDLRAHPETHLNGLILGAVDDAFHNVVHAYEQMDAENIPSIHKLRIAFKKFRYSIEIVHPLLGHFPSENFKRMHDYQSKMGDIQDAEVKSRYLVDLNASKTVPAFEIISAGYILQLQTTIRTYLEDKGEVFVFWRAAPEQTFPWEK